MCRPVSASQNLNSSASTTRYPLSTRSCLMSRYRLIWGGKRSTTMTTSKRWCAYRVGSRDMILLMECTIRCQMTRGGKHSWESLRNLLRKPKKSRRNLLIWLRRCSLSRKRQTDQLASSKFCMKHRVLCRNLNYSLRSNKNQNLTHHKRVIFRASRSRCAWI
jgi:hypothetical protein